MHKYEIIIYWSEADQVYVADVPELPGGYSLKSRKGACYAETI